MHSRFDRRGAETGDCLRLRRIRAIAISDDDRYVAVAGRDGTIRIWDLTEHQLVRENKAHAQRIRAIAFAQEESS